MTTYNYFKNVREDVKQAILNNYSLEELHCKGIEERLYNELFYNDSVTGKPSGSYTLSKYQDRSRYQAEEYLTHNFDALLNALNEFGIDIAFAIRMGAEFCDVIIRCYILRPALYDVLNELLNK